MQNHFVRKMEARQYLEMRVVSIHQHTLYPAHTKNDEKEEEEENDKCVTIVPK